MVRKIIPAALLLVLIVAVARPNPSDSNFDLHTFFRQNIGLNEDQIAAIRGGKAVTKSLPPRTPAEVLLFGAIYIHASPEAYLKFACDFNRLRKVPGFLALRVFSTPPRLSDLEGFALESDDLKALKNCAPGNCQVQMPATAIEALHQSIDWSAPDVDEHVNRLLRSTALDRLLAYQREGNSALGVYNDKREPTAVPEQFAYLLSYARALSEHGPDFYHFLLYYPQAKPANYEDTFYWAKVKFGLKPTLRLVQMVTMRGAPTDPIANAVAQKQLYSSHYFETALDLSVCVREGNDPKRPDFYLMQVMGSEQAGLTGLRRGQRRSQGRG